MKLKTILAGALALGITSSAMAQTDITITGATAFRQATMQAIYNAYASINNGLGNNFNVAHDFAASGSNNLSQLLASNKAIFVGTFPGIDGTTTIRTSFNGSTEGLNVIAGNATAPFYQAGVTLPAGITPSYGGTTEQLRAKFAFSDVYQSTSPVDNIVLSPPDSAVGVVTFAMIVNEGAVANLTNATIQQCRALWASGSLPASLFTGDPADTSLVLATGRNDGSGTRSAYLTEWTYGVASTVQQFVTTATGTNASGIVGLTLVPIGANLTNGSVFSTGRANDASTLWGNDNVGNGGYSSSSALRTIMGLPSTNTTLYDGETSDPIGENLSVTLMTWLSTADSLNAVNAGGRIIAFNGEMVTPLVSTNPANFNQSGFNEADFYKMAEGAYSPWSFQHLYYHGSLSGNESLWYNAMKNTYLPVGLQQTANGLRLGDMQVTRSDDGFPIVPLL
jgi:hypothetical protein